MQTRRVRLESTALTYDRKTNPVLLVIAVVLGLFVGLGYGFRDVFASGRVDRDDSYLVLASTLYGLDPTTASAIRDKLVSVGFVNPTVSVHRLSEQYAATKDRQKQQEAQGLSLLSDALSGVPDSSATPGLARATSANPLTGATPAPGSTPRPGATPDARQTPGSSPVAQSGVGTATSAGSTIPPEPTSPAAPRSAATEAPSTASLPAPTATSAPLVQGTPAAITSADKVAVRIRKEPSTESAVVGIVPYGAKVQVLKQVNGSADDPGIDPAELRWYQITYKNMTGYVYFKLINIGG